MTAYFLIGYCFAGIKKLDIHTDSQFMINCITDWMKKWKKNNWVTSNGGAVKNKEQLQILDKAISSLDAVRWVSFVCLLD